MQIRLISKSVSMWFLGEPRNIVATLNFMNPGPIEIDFDELTLTQKKQLLQAVNQGIVASDTNIALPDEVTQPQPIQQSGQVTTTPTVPVISSINQLIQAKNQVTQEQCINILRNTVRAIKVMVSEANDLRLTKNLLNFEENNQKRISVIKFLKEKIESFEKAVTKLAEKEKLDSIRAQKKTIEYSVVESEMRKVAISPEELIALSYEVPLK